MDFLRTGLNFRETKQMSPGADIIKCLRSMTFYACRRSLTLLHCRRTLTFSGFDKAMRIRTPIDVGAVIRDRRRKLQLDQKSLADKVGVSRQWIVEVEKGKHRAEIGLVLRTIEALGINLAVDEPRRVTGQTSPPPVGH
jgi:HTH-type transcriptional regulator/antitoxin HipB